MYQGSDNSGMGEHLLLNLKECGNIARLKNLSEFRSFIDPLLVDCGAVILSSVSHQFDGGFTHLSLLSTSHFSAHTWPELGSVAADLFTCSDSVDTETIILAVIEYFQSKNHLILPVLR